MEKYERFTHEGVELLHVRMSLPQVADADAINDFYEELGKAAYAFCQAKLLPHARACYESDPDPRRHVHFCPFRYRLWGETCYRNDGLLSVRIEAILAREGVNGERHRFFDAQNFSLPDGALLSPRDALSLYLGEPVSKKRCKNIQSLLLTDRAAYTKHDDAWELLAQ